jgi:hypothetical protein
MRKKMRPNGAWTLCEVQSKYHLNHDLNRIDIRDTRKEGQQSGVIAKLPSSKHPQLCTNVKVDENIPTQTRGVTNVNHHLCFVP